MSFAKNSIIYLLSNITNAAIPFVLLPILTRVLSQSEYGRIAMFQTLLVGLTAFVGLNSVGAANRKYYDVGISQKELSQYNGACIQILLFSILVLLIVFYFIAGDLAEILSIPISWLYSALLLSSLIFLLNLRLGQWQIRGSAFKFGQLQVSNSLFNMGLSLLLVVMFNHGAQGRVDAQVIAASLSAMLACWLLVKDKLVSLWQWRFEHIKQALSFGVPLIPHIFGTFLITTIDRFVINQKLGLSYAGIYMVAVQLSLVLNVIFDAINKAYSPWLFSVLKRNQDTEKYRVVKYTYLFGLLLLLITPIAFIIGPPVLVFIAGEDYRMAGQVIGLLCLGQIFGGMYLMITNYVFYAKNTGQLAIVTILSGCVNLILLIYFIDIKGIVGVALAFAISKALQFLMTFILAVRSVKMPWMYFKLQNY